MDKKHRGALSELAACCWLLKEGFEVFRNVSAHGEFDLVIRDPDTGALAPVDVTTGAYYVKKDGSRTLNFSLDKLTKAGRILVVAGEECLWASQADAGASKLPPTLPIP